MRLAKDKSACLGVLAKDDFGVCGKEFSYLILTQE